MAGNAGNEAYRASKVKGSPATNTNGGRVYKRDFAKDGTDAPSDWGDCCKGGKPMGERVGY